MVHKGRERIFAKLKNRKLILYFIFLFIIRKNGRKREKKSPNGEKRKRKKETGKRQKQRMLHRKTQT